MFTESSDEYTGVRLDSMTTLNNTGGANYNGICNLFYNNYDGDPISDYHDLVVGTLRSRGTQLMGQTLVQYILYQVQVMSYLIVRENILQSQKIHYQHSNIWSDIFFENFFETSSNTSVNYINKVFGRVISVNLERCPIILEEEYSNLLNTGYKLGKIRGLNCSLLKALLEQLISSLGWYLDKYRTRDTFCCF